ncbi:unnamed protein product [Mytilus edulis]|uniref:Uncharacterized protein n=1 Tax=Mytilus edulis TaxID=6550 RepID=A0A8S3TDP3_MYTED|nr:unnamed protein product [Mytilus edulis]
MDNEGNTGPSRFKRNNISPFVNNSVNRQNPKGGFCLTTYLHLYNEGNLESLEILRVISMDLENYEYFFEIRTVSIDHRRGNVTLIPKKEKGRTLLSKWRMSKSNCGKNEVLLLPKLKDPDQTGYAVGRYIGEKLRFIADSILFTTLKNYPGLIFLVDFEKVFNTLEWKLVQKHWSVLILVASSGNGF